MSRAALRRLAATPPARAQGIVIPTGGLTPLLDLLTFLFYLARLLFISFTA